jgi:hypothetical protein
MGKRKLGLGQPQSDRRPEIELKGKERLRKDLVRTIDRRNVNHDLYFQRAYFCSFTI